MFGGLDDIYLGIKLQKQLSVNLWMRPHMYQGSVFQRNLFPVKEGLICFTPNIKDTDKLVKIRYTSNQPCPEK